MATIVTKMVDPDNGPGTDYTSLSAWEAGEQKDLVAADEIAVASCRSSAGSADTNLCNIDGWVADSTRYVKVWTDPALGNRHNGVWDVSKYRIVVLYNAIRAVAPYTKIIGMQIFTTLTSSTLGGIYLYSGHTEVGYSIIKGGGSTSLSAIYCNDALHKIWNNIIYSSRTGIFVKAAGTSYNFFYNNTIYDCSYGIRQGSNGRSTCKNDVIQNCGACYSGGSFVYGDPTNNISSDATAPGDNPKPNTIVLFANVSENDFHLHNDDIEAFNAGADLSADTSLPFTDDIDGDLRPVEADWDIGADERGFLPPPPPPPPRVSLIIPDWEQGISIKRAWKTTIQRSITGKEKRSALFTWPRKSIRYRSVALTSKEINWQKRGLYLNASGIWDMPFWPDWVVLTAEAAEGANSLSVDDTRYRAFQAGKNCILCENYLSFEMVEILSFTQTTITLNAVLDATWLAGTKVYPVIKARVNRGHSEVSMITDRAGRSNVSVTEIFE